MYIKYNSVFYVSENDMNEICKAYKRGALLKDAIYNVAEGWDDIDYYTFSGCEEIYNQLENEIKRRCEK